MLYEATPNNLRLAVRTAGYLAREQLIRFFSDTDDALNVEYYIREFVAERILDYDEKVDVLSWHSGPKVGAADIANRIKAFWIITSFRSKAVKEILLLPYPSQFIFITSDNAVYDISVCSSTMEAMLVERNRKMTLCEGVEDEVNHIAIVNSERLGEQLGAYGFDSYCTLDREHRPHYCTWN